MKEDVETYDCKHLPKELALPSISKSSRLTERDAKCVVYECTAKVQRESDAGAWGGVPKSAKGFPYLP